MNEIDELLQRLLIGNQKCDTAVAWQVTQLEFRESDVSPGNTEIKQGKFVKLISPAKG